MTDDPHDTMWSQDAQALIKLAKLTQSLKHLGEAAQVVNREAMELARHFDGLLTGASAADSASDSQEVDYAATAAFGAQTSTISFQDMERRRRYYAGLPPMDEIDAAFQQAMRESEHRSRLAQGGFPLDDEDDD